MLSCGGEGFSNGSEEVNLMGEDPCYKALMERED